MSLFRRVLLAVFVIFAAAPRAAFADAQTPADIVIMLDMSGSINFTDSPVNDLENEKSSARELLTFFTQAAVKPRVAIGTFNACDLNPSEPECDNLQARILPNGSLTSDYGVQAAGTGLYGVLNTLTRTSGFTDLSQAIAVARQHLSGQNSNSRKYIIIITDGVPNRPGGPDEDTYGNCSGCGCSTAYDAASAAALAAKNQDIQIFTVHYTGHTQTLICPNEPAAGRAFLQQSVATSGSLFYEGDNGLADTFSQVSFAITCDNGDPCTKGVYNPATGVCTQQTVTSDTDGDGVPDCQDKCNGNDALLGQACSAGAGVCAVTGTWGCGIANVIVCSGTPLDEKSCFECTNYPVDNALNVLHAHFLEEAKTLRAFGLQLSRSTSDKKLLKFAAQTTRLGKNIKTVTITTLNELPAVMPNCTNALACVRIGNESTFGSLNSAAQAAFLAVKQTGTKLRKLGKLTKDDKKMQRRMQFLSTDTTSVTAGMPQYQSSCSIKGS
jgi:hypothetical protein